MYPESDILKLFFQSEKLMCEGLLSVEECAKALSRFKNNLMFGPLELYCMEGLIL